MKEHFIQIQRKARYRSIGNPAAKQLLIVLHGYGQLTEYFLRKFDGEEWNDFYIVAPEGLHRFYLEGTQGRVGASWMTKELRHIDIEENSDYLDTLLFHLQSENQYESTHLLGFSQGGATAARWKQRNPTVFESFVLWASVFPDDVKVDLTSEAFHRSQNHFVLGTQDPFYSVDQQQKISSFYTENQFKVHIFEGGHVLVPEILVKIYLKNK
jgi:predicted esterase